MVGMYSAVATVWGEAGRSRDIGREVPPDKGGYGERGAGNVCGADGALAIMVVGCDV